MRLPTRQQARFASFGALLIAGAAMWIAAEPGILPGVAQTPAQAQGVVRASDQFNGFDVSNASIPQSEIRRGGPPRDGIPAILEPKFVPVDEVDYLRPDDLVGALGRGPNARAYPLRILVWHEIVNDTVAGQPVAMTYCPLCGTVMAFDRRAGGTTRTFGVSGLLYNSDVLMYDHQTESLWSQLAKRAVAGPALGVEMQWIPAQLMRWEAWRTQHPMGQVLSTDTGHARDYNRAPYQGYEETERLYFPVTETRDDLPRKAWVVGVVVAGQPRAYPLAKLRETGTLNDTVAGKSLTVSYDAEASHAVVRDETGMEVPSVRVYWFAWQAFYPETALVQGAA